MKELFSVVITTCNRQVNILKEAIDSVINQSYSNIEIIIVNDSPNNPNNSYIKRMVSSYGNKVQYFVNKKQMGANYSRNFGAKVSKGQYLSFLDDDDYWDENRIEKFWHVFQKHYDLVFSDFIIFCKKKTRYSKRINPKHSETLKTMLSTNFLGGFSNVAFTRSCFIKAGMLDESMPSYQDQDLFIRMIQHGKIGYINEPLSYYRITEGSISLNPINKINGLKMFLEKYSDFYNMYPESKKTRLENELVYSIKQGWISNKNEIKSILLHYDSRIRVLYLEVIGAAKWIAVNVFKLM